MVPPPESLAGDSCYSYSELIKIDINKNSKVVSIKFSDSAPDWLNDFLKTQQEKKRINIIKLDSLAKAVNIKNCTLLFPFIVESDGYPCGVERKKRSLPAGYFNFSGVRPSGNIIIESDIHIIFPVNYKHK